MKPIVERFEIKKNNFSKWIFGALTLLSVFAFVISWSDNNNTKWMAAASFFIFGAGWLMTINHKIIVYQEGFDMSTFGKTKSVNWREITSLSFQMVYPGHSVEARLKIQVNNKTISLPVKQYQYQTMQRFFEVLNEQCDRAIKNDHFIKQANGTMNWKNKLKMY